MKFNDKELHDLSRGPCDLEGRLSFKKTNMPVVSSSSGKSGFKERWFKLKHNLLFYFKTNEIGQIDYSQPTGMFVLENSSVYQESCAGVPFAFSLMFKDEPEKKYIISTRSEQDVLMWMSALKKVSYEYLRSQLVLLQNRIKTLTGKDPLLLVPRNTPTHVYSTSSCSYDSQKESRFYETRSHDNKKETRNHGNYSETRFFDNHSTQSFLSHTELSVQRHSSRQVFAQSTRSTSSNFYTPKDLPQPTSSVPIGNLIDL